VYVNYSAEQCLKLETLFLVRVRERYWNTAGEPVGCMLKVDLRPFGRSGTGYSYDGDEYREANGAEKILVYSGKRDVIIWRK